MDILSYLIGLLKGIQRGIQRGTGTVILEGSGYVFTDSQNNGNVVISKGGN